MAKKSAIEVFELAQVLNARGLTAKAFNNGLHFRINENGVELWPTTGTWKWMGMRGKGTIIDFVRFLDTVKSKQKLLSSVITNIDEVRP